MRLTIKEGSNGRCFKIDSELDWIVGYVQPGDDEPSQWTYKRRSLRDEPAWTWSHYLYSAIVNGSGNRLWIGWACTRHQNEKTFVCGAIVKSVTMNAISLWAAQVMIEHLLRSGGKRDLPLIDIIIGRLASFPKLAGRKTAFRAEVESVAGELSPQTARMALAYADFMEYRIVGESTPVPELTLTRAADFFRSFKDDAELRKLCEVVGNETLRNGRVTPSVVATALMKLLARRNEMDREEPDHANKKGQEATAS